MGPGDARPELAGVFRDVHRDLLEVTLGNDGSCVRLLVAENEPLGDVWWKNSIRP